MKYILKVPEPCHEDWSQMTPTEKGKFCGNCKREVVDFTNHSNYEIVRKLDRRESICGRLKETQLNKELSSLQKKNYFKVSVAASITAVLSSFSPSFGQIESPKIEVLDSVYKTQKTKIVPKKKKDTIVIEGIVSDGIGSLPGVKISFKKSKIQTETDINGNFLVEIPFKKLNRQSVLVFSFIGMNDKEIIVNENTAFLKVEINPQDSYIGAVVITKYSKKNNIFRRIGNLFRKKENRIHYY